MDAEETNRLIDEETPTFTKWWSSTTSNQKFFIVVTLLLICFFAWNSRLIDNTKIIEKCTEDRSICKNETALVYESSSKVPAQPFSLFNAGTLIICVILLVGAFLAKKISGPIDMNDALKIAQKQCDDLTQANIGKFANYKYVLNGKAKLQYKLFDTGKLPNKWFVGVNLKQDYHTHYYIMFIDAISGKIDGLANCVVDGMPKEFDGSWTFDEKILMDPRIKEARDTAEAYGFSSAVRPGQGRTR